MPLKKRPKKAYRRKYSADQIRNYAIGRFQGGEPLERDRLVQAMSSTHAALEAIVHGRGTMHEAGLLGSASNLAMAQCEQGLGDDEDLEVAKAGRDALVSMSERCKATGKWGLSGAELKAVARMLDLRDSQLESEDNTKGLEIQAAKNVDKRIESGNAVRVVEFA